MPLSPTQTKNILIAPLDWGIGHATRCTPIIRYLVEKGLNVIVAAENRPLNFLKIEFPGLAFIKFPNYKITYPKGRNMIFKMLVKLPGILKGIYKEHHFLREVIKEYSIDAVISDNRYGMWNKSIPCVFITHQFNIILPKPVQFLSPIIRMMNKFFINKYSEVWIPDDKKLNLTGKLSREKRLKKPVKYIGILSRFEKRQEKELPYNEVLVLISGPEPQRSIFEEKIIAAVLELEVQAIILRGVTETIEEKQLENIKIINHLGTSKLEELILGAEKIICRPGYSTIMDLVTLGKKAILIPTPGQTEQEYLAKQLSQKGYFTTISQDKITPGNLLKDLPAGQLNCTFNEDYKKFINNFLDKYKLLTPSFISSKKH